MRSKGGAKGEAKRLLKKKGAKIQFLKVITNFSSAGGPWGPQGEGGLLRDPSVRHQASPPLPNALEMSDARI